MKPFHKSSYGNFGSVFKADKDGYVATTPKDVMSLNWDGEMLECYAELIAEKNASAIGIAEKLLQEFLNSENGK